jgi:hypothetical protein
MLQVGDRVPHFEVTDLGGRTVRYVAIWQLRPIVLVCLPFDGSAEADAYAGRLKARTSNLTDVAVVVTRDLVADIAPPAAIVADQWGEVAHVATASRPEELPNPDALLDWVRFLQIRCPECEGEAR